MSRLPCPAIAKTGGGTGVDPRDVVEKKGTGVGNPRSPGSRRPWVSPSRLPMVRVGQSLWPSLDHPPRARFPQKKKVPKNRKRIISSPIPLETTLPINVGLFYTRLPDPVKSFGTLPIHA